jgi:hypothetical protein
MKTWNMIDAQDHLEHIVQSAIEHRPQRIRLDMGGGEVVVVSAEDYARLAAHDLFAFLQMSPLAEAIEADGIDFEIERSTDPPRGINFD